VGNEALKIQYEIGFKNGRKKSFSLDLDPETLELVPTPRDSFPEWAKLGSCKCKNCPLGSEILYCPVMANLADVAECFRKDISYEEVHVTIRTPPRNYQREISLQDALRSIFGIYMVTSGCPILDKLRPMVRMHLPFATIQETAYRALSMYVLAQFFIQKKGGTPNWTLDGLGEIYQAIEIVNQGLHERLVKADFNDACLNAIGNLNCYAQFTQMFLEPGQLEKIEKLFAAYLKN
jgi:hypothetical protein